VLPAPLIHTSAQTSLLPVLPYYALEMEMEAAGSSEPLSAKPY